MLYTNFDIESQTLKSVFSLIENKLIKNLPTNAIEGCRLAKAYRIVHVIQPIVPKLIDLGVTVDIHAVIRTYHLKTCVFYLTKSYNRDKSDKRSFDRWKWAIAIFDKLREFILMGNIKEFFATYEYIFIDNEGEQECVHSEADFNVALPRFHCCRVRKARFLMVDQILKVLNLSQKNYYAKYKPISNAMNKIINLI